MPALLRALLPDPVLRLLRWLRRALLRTQDRVFPADLVHPRRPVLAADRPIHLLVGPVNFAGQGWAWSRAVERYLPGVAATAMSIERPGLAFDSDYAVPLPVYRSLRWQKEQLEAIERDYTHVLIEALRPVLGNRYGEDCGRESALLREAGLQVALVAHGTDIRRAALHRELYLHSPWNDLSWREGRGLDVRAQRLGALMAAFDGPTFVTTPDLLDFAPGAAWLPTVVDAALWRSDRPVLERRRPVVLHVPSNARIKGSHLADPVLHALHDQGRIEYRRLEGVPPQEMPRHVADADIVLDQLLIGSYGVMALQAMAAGRLVLGHVHERVRARVPQPVPVVEATAGDLADVLDAVLGDRAEHQAVAARGPAFVADVHDGRRSAAVLAPFLGAVQR